MTITLVADADREAHIEYIAGATIVPGHVIAYFDGDHRVDRFLVEQRAVDSGEVESWYRDSDRHPPRRTAVAADGWALTILADQRVPVRVPTTLYQLDVFQARTPDEPASTVPFAAETVEMAATIARRILVQAEAAWGDIRQGDRDIDTVAVR